MIYSFAKSDIYKMLSQNDAIESIIRNLSDLIGSENTVEIEGTSCSSKEEIQERLKELGY